MYHIVCPDKYRRAVITEEVDLKLREVCLGIEARLEIGVEADHVHFLVQSVPKYSPKQVVQTIKIFARHTLSPLQAVGIEVPVRPPSEAVAKIVRLHAAKAKEIHHRLQPWQATGD